MSADEESSSFPKHIAIITDGNGRWAQKRGLHVNEGHAAGADTVKARLKDCAELGVKQLAIWAFSTENWSRSDDEVNGLMTMFSKRIVEETPELKAEGVKIRFIGRLNELSERLQEQIAWSEAETADNDLITFFVPFNYGGRAEILDAAAKYDGGGEAEFRSLLYAPDLVDPDLVIRTSGEIRLSNYLLWQSAYSELVFAPELWPDFDRQALERCIDEYGLRQRRFGGR